MVLNVLALHWEVLSASLEVAGAMYYCEGGPAARKGKTNPDKTKRLTKENILYGLTYSHENITIQPVISLNAR